MKTFSLKRSLFQYSLILTFFAMVGAGFAQQPPLKEGAGKYRGVDSGGLTFYQIELRQDGSGELMVAAFGHEFKETSKYAFKWDLVTGYELSKFSVREFKVASKYNWGIESVDIKWMGPLIILNVRGRDWTREANVYNMKHWESAIERLEKSER